MTSINGGSGSQRWQSKSTDASVTKADVTMIACDDVPRADVASLKWMARGSEWRRLWRLIKVGGECQRSFLRDQIFRQHVRARGALCRVDFGWVILGIVRSINRCLRFSSLVNKSTGSKSCSGCGFNGGNLLLIMHTRQRRGQRKDAEEDH